MGAIVEYLFSGYSDSLKNTILSIASKNSVTHLNLLSYPLVPENEPYEDPHSSFREQRHPSDDPRPERVDFKGVPRPKLVSLEEFANIDLGNLSKDQGTLTGLCSLVRLNNGLSAHLPQIDIDGKLDIATGFNSLGLIATASLAESVRSDPAGYIINSGSGYHIYGSGLIDPNSWNKWVENLSAISKSIDQGWINLATRRGYSVLRLDTNPLKSFAPSPFAQIKFKFH